MNEIFLKDILAVHVHLRGDTKKVFTKKSL